MAGRCRAGRQPAPDVLHTRTVIELEIFIDLRLLLALGRLVDRELDAAVAIAHHLRHQRRVLGADRLVVEREDVGEAQHILVELDPGIHPAQLDVADTVIDILEPGAAGLERRRGRLEARQEQAAVIATLHDRVDGVAIGADRRNDDLAIGIADHFRIARRRGPALECHGMGRARILHPERHVAHAVTMQPHMLGDFAVRTKGRREHEAELVLHQQV